MLTTAHASCRELKPVGIRPYRDRFQHRVEPSHVDLLSHVCNLHCQHACSQGPAHPLHGGQYIKDAVALWYTDCTGIRVHLVRVNGNQQLCYSMKVEQGSGIGKFHRPQWIIACPCSYPAISHSYGHTTYILLCLGDLHVWYKVPCFLLQWWKSNYFSIEDDSILNCKHIMMGPLCSD